MTLALLDGVLFGREGLGGKESKMQDDALRLPPDLLFDISAASLLYPEIQ